eukprot:gene11110-biopygen13471
MPRRPRRNFDQQRARERQRQYYQNHRNNNRPPNADEQQLADAVNELVALELHMAQNELPNQQGNNEADIFTKSCFQGELMTVNPFARQFQNMGQVLERERNNAAANNQPLPPVRMIIAQRPFQDNVMIILQPQKWLQFMLEMKGHLLILLTET